MSRQHVCTHPTGQLQGNVSFFGATLCSAETGSSGDGRKAIRKQGCVVLGEGQEGFPEKVTIGNDAEDAWELTGKNR